MDNTTNKKNGDNLQFFSQSYDDLLNTARNYIRKDDYSSALLFANQAYSLSGGKRKVLMMLSKIYCDLENFSMAFNCASRFLALYEPDNEERSFFAGLVPLCLVGLKRTFASLYYMSKYQLPPEEEEYDNFEFASDDLSDEELEDLEEIEELSEDYDEENDYDEEFSLKFADEKRAEYNREVFGRAKLLYNSGDYKGALDLCKSMYDEKGDRAERVCLTARCYAETKQKSKAFDLLEKQYLSDKTQGEMLWEILSLGKKYYPRLTELIETFKFSEKNKSMEKAVFVANALGLDDLAIKIIERLKKDNYNKERYRLMYYFALWNVGHKDVKKSIMSVLYQNRSRFPVAYLEKVRFPVRFSLEYEEIPVQLFNKFYNLLKKDVPFYEEKIVERDFADAIVFALTSHDGTIDETLLNAVEESTKAENLAVIKRICGFMCDQTPLQKCLINVVMDKYPQVKTILLNTEGFLMDVPLVLSKRYSEYPQGLKDEYRYAYTLLVEFERKMSEDLIKYFDLLFDTEYYLDMEEVSVAEVMVFALVKRNTPQILEEFCSFNNIDATAVRRHADGLLEALDM